MVISPASVLSSSKPLIGRGDRVSTKPWELHAAAKAKRQEAGARVRIALRKQLFNLNSGLGFDDELFETTRTWVRVAIEQGAVNAQELWAEFLAGVGERAWLAHRTFQLAWKRYSGKYANILYEGPAEFAPQNVPETAKPVRTFSEEDRTLLSGFGLQALVYTNGSVALTGKTYEHKNTIRPFATYDSGS